MKTHIALLAALPEEYKPVKKLLGPWKELLRQPFKISSLSCSDKELMLVETGMGRSRACQALEWVLRDKQQDLLLSFGFGGGLSKDATVGSVFLANVFIPPNTPPSQGFSTGIQFQPAEMLSTFCREHGVKNAQLVTVDRVIKKTKVTRPSLEKISLVDMESYFLAECALKRGVSLICLRAVSDGVDEEIDYDVDTITDSSGSVQISKVLLQILKRPALASSFYTSWKHSSMAAHALSHVLSAFLRLPAAHLHAMASQSRLMRSSDV